MKTHLEGGRSIEAPHADAQCRANHLSRAAQCPKPLVPRAGALCPKLPALRDVVLCRKLPVRPAVAAEYLVIRAPLAGSHRELRVLRKIRRRSPSRNPSPTRGRRGMSRGLSPTRGRRGMSRGPEPHSWNQGEYRGGPSPDSGSLRLNPATPARILFWTRSPNKTPRIFPGGPRFPNLLFS